MLNKKFFGFTGKTWLILGAAAVGLGLWWRGHVPDVPGVQPRQAIQRQVAGRRTKKGVPGQRH